MTINPSYLPDSVAFKRVMRDLIRQANYVPPYQEPAQAITAAEFGEAVHDEVSPAALTGGQVGEWTLATNDRGDVIWRHTNGYEYIVAQLPEGDVDG